MLDDPKNERIRSQFPQHTFRPKHQQKDSIHLQIFLKYLPSLQDTNCSCPLEVPTTSWLSLGLCVVNARQVNLTLAACSPLKPSALPEDPVGLSLATHLILPGWPVADFETNDCWPCGLLWVSYTWSSLLFDSMNAKKLEFFTRRVCYSPAICIFRKECFKIII